MKLLSGQSWFSPHSSPWQLAICCVCGGVPLLGISYKQNDTIMGPFVSGIFVFSWSIRVVPCMSLHGDDILLHITFYLTC